MLLVEKTRILGHEALALACPAASAIVYLIFLTKSFM